MDCVCGYTTELEPQRWGEREKPKPKPFAELGEMETQGEWFADKINLDVYACPKCGTLKVDPGCLP